MDQATLEKIDLIRERTNASYLEAKKALEACDGNVVDALIYIEENKESPYMTKDEFVNWIKNIVQKGNITRIKIKKDKKVIVDMPVNAGAMVTLLAFIASPVITIMLFAAALTQITIEITKEDGTVEVINKIIKSTVENAKDKACENAANIKEKFSNADKKKKNQNDIYSYSVDFDDEESKQNTNDEK